MITKQGLESLDPLLLPGVTEALKIIQSSGLIAIERRILIDDLFIGSDTQPVDELAQRILEVRKLDHQLDELDSFIKNLRKD